MQIHEKGRQGQRQGRERDEAGEQDGLPDGRSRLWDALQKMQEGGVCRQNKEQNNGAIQWPPSGSQDGG